MMISNLFNSKLAGPLIGAGLVLPLFAAPALAEDVRLVSDNQCNWENDGTCDVPHYCPEGTDVVDCSAAEAEGVEEVSPYATVTVCNKHWRRMDVVIGARIHPGDEFTTFMGWFKIAAGNCREIGMFAKGYMYFHADDANGNLWGTEKNFCVKQSKFRYLRNGIGRCSERTAKFDEKYVTADEYTLNVD